MGNGEADRLKEIYKKYRDPCYRQRWDPSNLGNRAIVLERQRLMALLLRRYGFLPLKGKKILDVGCGYGGVLAELAQWGAEPKDLVGVDLLPDRIEAARRAYPGIHFECRNAECLEWPDESFDLVLLFTVFSSILDERMAYNVAREVRRVLKRGGAIIWYDFRYNNPNNPHTRGIRKKDLQRYFPGFAMHIVGLTLLPPLARRLGTATRFLYPILASVPPLRTHYLGLLVKP